MNKAQRAPWIAVDPNYILCNWCRYGEWLNDDVECQHPVEAVGEFHGEYMSPLSDCWGFRPRKGLTVDEAQRYAVEERGERECE